MTPESRYTSGVHTDQRKKTPSTDKAAADSTRVLQPGEVLFAEGDMADCAFIIESGELEISTDHEDGKVVICNLAAGDIVGEMGVVDSTPRTASATALGETCLVVVSRDQLSDRIASADPILKLLIKILLDRHSEERADDALISTELVGEYVRHGIDKIRLESELKRALAKGELEVFYQPILDPQRNRLAGFEALTRWHNPVRGHIPPHLFIALAEETDLIVPVGLQVFKTACRQLAKFQAIADQQPAAPPLFMCINISARQIADRRFIGQAAALASAAGINREQVKLEITETLAVDIDLTQTWIKRAHELGFKVSLDDFGTGYSSLETLYKLDLDTAKIDQTFVRPLHREPRSRELMRGMVELMKSLQLEIVVEGIESPADLEFVTAIGCHLTQGYLIGKPLPATAAEALLGTAPALEMPG